MENILRPVFDFYKFQVSFQKFCHKYTIHQLTDFPSANLS